MSRSLFLVALLPLLAAGLADPAPAPAPAPAPVPTAAPLDPRAITTTRFVPTEYWDYATTSIVKDEYFMGIVSVTSPDGLWYLHCINAPLTTTSGFAGCGRDDLYTSCSGTMAYGIDGDAIRCANGFRCVTHKIFENFESYSSSSYTPFLGCGKATASLEMIRTPPASFESSPTPTRATTGASLTSTGAVNTASTTGNGTSIAARHATVPEFYAAMLAFAVVVLTRTVC